MNKQRLKILAQAVLENPKHFDMREGFANVNSYKVDYPICGESPYFDKIDGKATFIGNCGTTCCFAGMAISLFSDESRKYDCWDDISAHAAKILELTPQESKSLFEKTLNGYSMLCDDKSYSVNCEEYAQKGYDRIHDFMKEKNE